MAFRNRWPDSDDPTWEEMRAIRIDVAKRAAEAAKAKSKPAEKAKATPKRKPKPARRLIRSEGRTRYYNHHGKEIMGQITMKLYYDESDD